MIILDTNVISEVLKETPAIQVARWFGEQEPARVFTTSVTRAEILYGIEILPLGQRRESLRDAVTKMLQLRFAERVLPFDEVAAEAFALIAAQRRRRGQPINQFDAQIAAIARARGAAVATRDMGDFSNCGIELIDPWV